LGTPLLWRLRGESRATATGLPHPLLHVGDE
jgi:hypothetical protein